MATRVVRDNRAAMLRRYESQAEKMLAKAALDCEGRAKVAAPVATGFLRNSIRAERVGRLHWRVSVHAFYGIWVEMGTRFMAGRAFLMPAFVYASKVLKSALSRIGRFR